MSREAHAGLLDGLSDFQRATAEHAFRRLYLDGDSTRRFLVADETGLGKTHVAKGVIALTLEHLQQVDEVERIDIVYVCSNADIAAQNIRKLNVTGSDTGSFASRLGLLITQPEMLRPTKVRGRKPAMFVAFTPATSFQLGRQMGKAGERAVLYLLLRDHLGLRGARATAAQRIFQGAVGNRDTFVHEYLAYAESLSFEPKIRTAFLRAFDASPEQADLLRLVDAVAGRRSLAGDQRGLARRVVAGLRQLLAHAAVLALEPDLVILDEFQRFRDLLDIETGDAAELTHHFFNQPHARVLLLSATPYKPFTYAEESADGVDHYSDFMKTLQFLAGPAGSLDPVRHDLDAFRRAALAGEPVAEIRDRLQSRLRRVIARTERPAAAQPETRTSSAEPSLVVYSDDFSGYVALRRIAEEVNAPLTVEYWKSAPYFLNFLDGYRVGERLREQMRSPEERATLMPLLRGAQRIARSDVERFRPLDWANARLRALASDTIDGGLWRLLWMPASLPYHEPGGPYASVSGEVTKRLIFSSWVAAPSAIASLLSYEVERRIFEGAGLDENTPAARAAISSRLDYRMAAGRPAAMSTLSLFWPHAALAAITDPLDAPRDARAPLSVNDLVEWASRRVAPLIGEPSRSRSTASAAWHWASLVAAERRSELGQALIDEPQAALVETLLGSDRMGEAGLESSGALDAHVSHLLDALGGWTPDVERPADLMETSALLGLGAPGNIAWRALARLRQPGDEVTPLGHWRAAAVLASGLRSLFSRPDAMLLLDSVYDATNQAGATDDRAYWRTVARYCLDGGLQAVLDEYIHHLSGEVGAKTTTDAGLIDLAKTARRAIALRESVYRAADFDHSDERGIAFPSRFALRFGGARQAQDDVRLPEVRAAFNSPFWPFVLATTSVGQEGVDFHWWCHSIIHWNLPANPVDFEQREGRVNRYKGHAIRKNVAAAHRVEALAPGVTDPWSAAFEAAAAERDEHLGDLKPYWVYPGDAQVERRILAFPLSRDEERWRRLQESLALYRLAFGQPRQEDMLSALERRGVATDSDRIAELRIDLRPPSNSSGE